MQAGVISRISRVSSFDPTLLAMPNTKQVHPHPASGRSHPAPQPVAAGKRRRTAPSTRGALQLLIAVDPVVEVIRRHLEVPPSKLKRLREDLAQALALRPVDVVVTGAPATSVQTRPDPGDEVMTTQEAADLVGVSRPYLVRQIDSGALALHQQVGNQRRVLRSDVLAWHARDQARRKRALGRLSTDLDDEIFG
jgi:excisionase family DNA binding protein